MRNGVVYAVMQGCVGLCIAQKHIEMHLWPGGFFAVE